MREVCLPLPLLARLRAVTGEVPVLVAVVALDGGDVAFFGRRSTMLAAGGDLVLVLLLALAMLAIATRPRRFGFAPSCENPTAPP
jgi:hypothetical protein